MKRSFLILTLTLLCFMWLTPNAAARGRHHHYGYGYGIALGLLFLAPLLYRPHYVHRPYYYGYPYRPYYPPNYPPNIYLDSNERALLSQKTQYTLEFVPSGTPIRWTSLPTGSEGSVVAHPAFKNTRGQFCRGYEQTIRYGNLVRRGSDTACRLPDGRWISISNN
jgi:hypothetical protein